MKSHSATFHDFEETPAIVAKFIEPVLRKEDGPNASTKPNEKAGAVMGYLCTDLGRGGDVIVGNSTLIEQAMKDAKKDTVFGIRFEGKKKSTKTPGQMVNSFAIDEAETDEDVQVLLKKYADQPAA